MKEQNFKEVSEFIFYILTELSNLPIEDFIKEVNGLIINNNRNLIINDKIPFNFTKEKLMHYLIIANGLSAMKSNYLINMDIFI